MKVNHYICDRCKIKICLLRYEVYVYEFECGDESSRLSHEKKDLCGCCYNELGDFLYSRPPAEILLDQDIANDDRERMADFKVGQ